jgi:hypothetical protein
MDKNSDKYQLKRRNLTISLEENLKDLLVKLPKPKPKATLPIFKPPAEPKLSGFKSYDRGRQNSLFKQIVTSGRRINFDTGLPRPEPRPMKNLASIEYLSPKIFEASAIVRGNVLKQADRHTRKSTDFLASVDSSRKNIPALISKLSDTNSKAVFHKIRLIPAQPVVKKDTPPPKAQVSSIIFNPERATNNRQTMTCNFLREKFGLEKYEVIRKMYLEKQCCLREIETVLTESQKCLVKLFPIAFDFSTPTTQESRVSGRCSFK